MNSFNKPIDRSFFSANEDPQSDKHIQLKVDDNESVTNLYSQIDMNKKFEFSNELQNFDMQVESKVSLQNIKIKEATANMKED